MHCAFCHICRECLCCPLCLVGVTTPTLCRLVQQMHCHAGGERLTCGGYALWLGRAPPRSLGSIIHPIERLMQTQAAVAAPSQGMESPLARACSNKTLVAVGSGADRQRAHPVLCGPWGRPRPWCVCLQSSWVLLVLPGQRKFGAFAPWLATPATPSRCMPPFPAACAAPSSIAASNRLRQFHRCA
jgi:hypothetical protein